MVVFRIYFFLKTKKKGYRDMADPTSRPTSRPTYPTDLPADLANYKRARHIPKSRPILENPPPKKSIMSRKNWPCVVVVVFRIYFFLNKKKKGYRDMADPTSRPPDLPTSRPPDLPTSQPTRLANQHTRAAAADTPTHTRRRHANTRGRRQPTHTGHPGGGCAVETTHRGGCVYQGTLQRTVRAIQTSQVKQRAASRKVVSLKVVG
jgi:hypothetical protein